MEMELLCKRVQKELDTIADKGITSNNLDTTYKLIDIYKDIKEVEQMENKRYDKGNYNERYNDRYVIDRYDNHPLDERTERYFSRMKDGINDYNAGRMRYRDGGSESRMIEGIEMTMGAVVNFVESLMDHSETSQEKEIIRKYINKIKNV